MERVLLTHCAPTLAGLKCANLVRLTGPRAELEAAAQAAFDRHLAYSPSVRVAVRLFAASRAARPGGV